MLKKSIEKALNGQVNAELASAYLYLGMNAYFQTKNLTGMANWMRIQVEEELDHSAKFYNYILSRGGKIALDPIAAPRMTWKSPLALFEATLKHEQLITRHVHKLVDLADREKDHATTAFLQWFVSEQVEEEANADEVVQRLKLAGSSGSAIFLVDQELGKRVPAAPSA